MSHATPILSLLRRVQSATVRDSELLDRYLRQRDAEAFRAIVEQHGGMVLAVCRRGVRSEADADDLFQATFLQLARSANRIQQPEALAAWLHGTARRLTLQWQKQQYRSLPPATSSASSDPLAEASWQEVRQLLDDELARLPLRLRSPLVLCYLEGLKGSEAAEQLGISLRTLRRDLDAGRVLLRERLAARGLKQLTLVAVLTASSGLLALPPPQLLNATLSQWAVWQAGQPLTSSVQSLLASSMPTLVPSMMSMILLTGITAFLFLATNPVSSPILPATPGRPVSVQVARQRVDSQGDPLPDGVLARLGSIRFRHGSAVYAMAFSKNDQRLYTGSNDGTLRCSSYPSGQVLWSVTMPNVAKNGFEAVVALAVSADDTLLAVSAMNDTTVVYDAHTGKELKRLGNDRDRSSWLAFSSDGKSLFAMTTTQATSMREYDLATGETISKKELSDCYDEAATTRNIHFAVDRNQARVVLADVKNLLVVYNLKTQQVERRLAQHPKPVVAVVWSEDGSAWLSLDSNKTLRRWDAKTGELQWSQTINAVQGNGMLALAGRGESARVILASDREIQFFNPHTGALQQTIPRRLMNYSLAFSHDSKVMAAAGAYGDVSFIDFTTLKPVAPAALSPITHGLFSLDYSPDSKQLVTGGVYDVTMVWDIASGKLVDQLNVRGKARFLNREQVVTAGWNVGGLATWNLGLAEKHTVFGDAILKPEKGIRELVLMPGGKQVLVAASARPKVSAWDIGTGKQVKSYDVFQAVPIRLACSPDGKLLAANEYSNVLTLCDTATGAKVHQQLIPGGQGGSVAFSPDSKLLAWSAGDNTIHIMNLATFKDQVVIENRGGPLDALTFSTDGRSLLWGGQHWPTIFVFDVHTGVERAQLRHHLGPIEDIRFAPDGHSFASASKDATVLVWDWHQYHARRGQSELPLDHKQREELFVELSGSDAKKSWSAVQRLVQFPTQALEWIDRQLEERQSLQAETNDEKVLKDRLAELLEAIDTPDSKKCLRRLHSSRLKK